MSWSSFMLGYLCGLMTLPRFTLLCLISVIGSANLGYGDDQ